MMGREGSVNIARMWVFNRPFQQSIVNLISQIPSIGKRQIVLSEEKKVSVENHEFHHTTENNWGLWTSLCGNNPSLCATIILQEGSTQSSPVQHQQQHILNCNFRVLKHDGAVTMPGETCVALSLFSFWESNTVWRYKPVLGWRFANTAHGSSETNERWRTSKCRKLLFLDLLCYCLYAFMLCS